MVQARVHNKDSWYKAATQITSYTSGDLVTTTLGD